MEGENLSWLDVMIILIFIFSILSSFRQGLILTLTSLISFFLSLVIANMFYKDLANYMITNTEVDEQLGSFLLSSSENSKVIETSSWMNGNVGNIPEGAKGYIQEILKNSINTNITSQISTVITPILIHIISFFVIFIVVRIVLYIASHGLNNLSKLPILNSINKVGGAFVGIVKGFIYSMLIVSIIYTFAIFGLHQGLANTIDNSILAQYFYVGYLFY